jgi:putative intracellular protease/amidase
MSHIEVDGRLVTGMNWESSVAVAEAVIRLLGEKK